MSNIKLPNNKKESFIYGSIICLITVIIMLTFNIYYNVRIINIKTIITILRLIPIIWIAAMIVETFFVGKISKKLIARFSSKTDGFNAKILFNILILCYWNVCYYDYSWCFNWKR